MHRAWRPLSREGSPPAPPGKGGAKVSGGGGVERGRPAADRDHRVDRLDAGLERLLDRLAPDDPRGLDLDAAEFLRLEGAPSVDRLPEGVQDASDQGVPDRHFDDAAGAADDVSLP